MAALSASTAVTPQDESLFEAFHSVYSALASSFYTTSLNTVFGVYFIYQRLERYATPPFVFCPDEDATHYRYKDVKGKLHDPYEMYQLPDSDGNCIFFALYIALSDRNPKGIPLPKLYDLRKNKLITQVKDGANSYWKVVRGKEQLAYKCFVHNDFEIFQWVFRTLRMHEFKGFKDEWDTMSAKEKKARGISPKCRLVDYISDFEKLMTMSESYKMTFDQIKKWDIQAAHGVPPHENTGIEGVASGLVNPDDYTFGPADRLVGGLKRKTRSKRR